MSYNNLINVNISPLNATKIGVYSGNTRVGKIELGNLKKSNLGNKLYSFGLISDVHLSYDTAEDDFKRALQFYNNEGVDFIIHAGDITANGAESEFNTWKTLRDTYSPNIPVYTILGNHDSWSWLNGKTGLSEEKIKTYTGQSLYYTVEKNNDLFIFVGCHRYTSKILFTTEELQWLYETLEQNRNKRVFLTFHVRPDDACGNAYGIYATDIWNGTESQIMESLFKHYKNITMFHGHSHLTLALQTKDNKANYDNIFGVNSIHVPSLTVPRVGDVSGASSRQEVYAKSEGYIVDVYTDGILLKGRDFVTEQYFCIATYYIPTVLQTIDAFSYSDSTETLDTSSTYSITNSLFGATNSNNSTTVTKWTSYSNTITANEGYKISNVIVTMGGTDITSSCYSNGTINIEKVTGDIVINATIVSTSNPCTRITLNNASLEFTSKGETKTLVATVTPSDTTDVVVWESNNTNVATVNNGVVTSIKNGTCIITAKCGSYSATCNITVSVPKPNTTITATQGTKIDKKTGVESSSDTYGASNYVEFDNSYTYTAHCSINSSSIPAGGDYAYSIVYYDSNKAFISCADNFIPKANGVCDKVIPDVTNAKYIRVRYYLGTNAVTTVFNGLTITC